MEGFRVELEDSCGVHLTGLYSQEHGRGQRDERRRESLGGKWGLKPLGRTKGQEAWSET